MSYSNLNISKTLGQDLKVNDIQCNTLNATTLDITDLSVDQLTITSGLGIINTTTDLNINVIDGHDFNLYGSDTGNIYIYPGASGYSYNNGRFDTNELRLQTTNGITTGAGLNLNINPAILSKFQKPIIFQNPYTTISTTSQFTGYSTGTFANSVGGGTLTPVAITIRYCRLGNRVDLFLPGFVIALNATPTAIRTLSTIPAELISTDTDFPSVITSATSGTNVLFSTSNFNTSFNKVFWYKGQADGWSTADGPSVIISACTLSYMIF